MNFHRLTTTPPPGEARRAGGVAFALGLLMLIPRISTAAEIQWHDSIESAREANPELPCVLFFTSESCTWCRKMQVSTFTDESVRALGEKFLFVRLDADEQEELSARYRVRGLPTLVVLDAGGQTLANRAGYQAAGKFVRFLEDSLTNPMPEDDPTQVILDEWKALKVDEERPSDLVERTVAHMARGDRSRREELLKAIAARSTAVQPALLELLGSQKLACRAAAFEALKQTTNIRHAFDPFASPEIRKSQQATWKAALGKKDA